MRLVMFDDHRVGTAEPRGIHDVTDLLSAVGPHGAPFRMNELIERWDELRPDLEARRRRGPWIPIEAVRLRAPNPRPTNLLAAPLNYRDHRAEMRGPMASGGTSVVEMGFFVKAAGSLCGASDAIELPVRPGRRFDHEGEIAFVVGREARAVGRGTALEHVFGYTLMVDATMRMTETEREERTLRKSFWTFSPLGPWIVTADEIPDPATLDVRLHVNGDLRQSGSLRDLVLDVPGLIEQASAVLPLVPGDIYATGTPAGVGPIEPGDQLVVASDAIGEMRLPVRQRAW